MHGSTCPVLYSVNLFYLTFFFFFLHCSYFSMPRISNNLRERAIGMLDAGMSTVHVARHVGCSS